MSRTQIYRGKAAEALELARQARQEGREAAHSGYVSEALFWKAHAEAITRKAEETGAEVTYP
jgi:hypothetical protein